jgi:hypothetical protein
MAQVGRREVLQQRLLQRLVLLLSVEELVLLGLLAGGALRRRRVDHKIEALLGGGELGDVVVRVGAADVFLHGAVPLFLRSVSSDAVVVVLWVGAYADTSFPTA